MSYLAKTRSLKNGVLEVDFPHLGKGIGSMFGSDEGQASPRAGSSDSARTKGFLIQGLNAAMLSEILLRLVIRGIISSNHVWRLLHSGPLGNLCSCFPFLSHHIIPYQSNLEEVYWEWECGFRDPQWPPRPGLPFECSQVAAPGKCSCHTSTLSVQKWPGLFLGCKRLGCSHWCWSPWSFLFSCCFLCLHHGKAAQTSGLLYQDCLERCLNPRMDDSALHPPSFLFCKLISQYKKILVRVQNLEQDFEMSCIHSFLHSNLSIVQCRAALSLRLCMFPFYDNERGSNVKRYWAL